MPKTYIKFKHELEKDKFEHFWNIAYHIIFIMVWVLMFLLFCCFAVAAVSHTSTTTNMRPI